MNINARIRLRLLAQVVCVTPAVILSLCSTHPVHAGELTYAVVHSFLDGTVKNDGAGSTCELYPTGDGYFYGTTGSGGSTGEGYGTAFKISMATGKVTILHSFGAAGIPNDGHYPCGGLILGNDGNFYGMTVQGGSYGYGTVYRMTATGTITIIHSFGDATVQNDGKTPQKSLIQSYNGELYGVTYAGGKYQGGTVFKITSAGHITILHSFGFEADGKSPAASPIQSVYDDNFYGTTEFGGKNSAGTVYRMTPSGTVTILHDFGNPGDGERPEAALCEDAYDPGTFIGTTNQGGTAQTGTAYEILATGHYTVLHSFGDGSVTDDGLFPLSSLIQDIGSGQFFGTTDNGGSTVTNVLIGYGTIYGLTRDGKVNILHSFQNGNNPSDGAFPYAGLSQDFNGDLYGTTTEGGKAGRGTVYELDANLTNPRPGPVLGVSAVPGDRQVTLSWTRTKYANSYDIYRTDGTGGVHAIASALTGFSYIDLNLTNGVAYSYYVKAVNKTGISPDYQTVTATPTPPSTQNLLVLQNGSTNQAAFWKMTANSMTSGDLIADVPTTGWKVVGMADFDGDGKPDLLLQQASTGDMKVWYMDGAARTGSASLSSSPGLGWTVIGVADFDGDGNPDIALAGPNGAIDIWYMNGVQEINIVELAMKVPAGYAAVGAGDFKGDGHVDLLFQNQTSGQLLVWYMKNNTVTGGAVVSKIPPAGWKVAAVDNLTDLVEPNVIFQDGTQLGQWQLNGVDYVDGGLYMKAVPAPWKIVGPK